MTGRDRVKAEFGAILLGGVLITVFVHAPAKHRAEMAQPAMIEVYTLNKASVEVMNGGLCSIKLDDKRWICLDPPPGWHLVEDAPTHQ